MRTLPFSISDLFSLLWSSLFRVLHGMALAALLVLAAGCASLGAGATGQSPDVPPVEFTDIDALELFNRKAFSFNDKVDVYILQPVTRGYVFVTPRLLRRGVANFFDNISSPNTIANHLLQGKVDQGLSALARFTFNSTIGLGGVVDVATVSGLPGAEREDLGQTLAVWGVGPGVYLQLPFLGSSTLRKLFDIPLSLLLNPLRYTGFAVDVPLSALRLVSRRASLLKARQIQKDAVVDDYVFVREAYLQRRQHLIYDGEAPLEEFDIMEFDPVND